MLTGNQCRTLHGSGSSVDEAFAFYYKLEKRFLEILFGPKINRKTRLLIETRSFHSPLKRRLDGRLSRQSTDLIWSMNAVSSLLIFKVCLMICIRAATMYTALFEKISLGDPLCAMNVLTAVKKFSFVRFSVASRCVASFVEQLKGHM